MRFLKCTMTILGMVAILWCTPAMAQVTITQVQQLNFGKWFFAGNTSTETITVSPVGVVNSSSPSIIMLGAPRPGIYNVTGLPPFTVINGVNVLELQSLQNGGQEITLDNFTTQIANADGSGNTQLRLGGEAQTSGDSQPYTGGIFAGQVSIEIDF